MGQKCALIIATAEYQDTGLARLNAPGLDAHDFAGALQSPRIGAFDSVQMMLNETEPVARRAIARFFNARKPDDLLLLYFSGHGVRDDHGQLYLAVSDTDRSLLSATAIPAGFINEQMNASRSRRQVLILDCCNSGAFAQGSKSPLGGSMGIATAFEGTGYGRVVLTATDATQYAWEGDEARGEAANSVFTHFLVQGLETGAADANGDGHITLDELYDYVYEQVVNQTPRQTPRKFAYNQQGEVVIAYNPRPPLGPAELPLPLQQALESSLAGVREGAVRELDSLLRGRHRGLAAAAVEALERLTNDDSRRVSSAAAASLAANAEVQRAAQAAEDARREQAQAERLRVVRELAEAQQRAAEKAAAAERAEQERLAQARLAAEQAAAERLASEQAAAEQERLAQARLEAEQAAAERLASEQAAAEWVAAKRAAAEKKAAEKKAAEEQLAEAQAERDRLARAKLERDHAAASQTQRIERERLESRLRAQKPPADKATAEKPPIAQQPTPNAPAGPPADPARAWHSAQQGHTPRVPTPSPNVSTEPGSRPAVKLPAAAQAPTPVVARPATPALDWSLVAALIYTVDTATGWGVSTRRAGELYDLISKIDWELASVAAAFAYWVAVYTLGGLFTIGLLMLSRRAFRGGRALAAVVGWGLASVFSWGVIWAIETFSYYDAGIWLGLLAMGGLGGGLFAWLLTPVLPGTGPRSRLLIVAGWVLAVVIANFLDIDLFWRGFWAGAAGGAVMFWQLREMTPVGSRHA